MSWTAACTLDAAPIGIASARVDGSDAAHSKVAAAASPKINFRIRSLFVGRQSTLCTSSKCRNAARRCYRRRQEQASAEMDHSVRQTSSAPSAIRRSAAGAGEAQRRTVHRSTISDQQK
jgi:hypothetical protein